MNYNRKGYAATIAVAFGMSRDGWQDRFIERRASKRSRGRRKPPKQRLKSRGLSDAIPEAYR